MNNLERIKKSIHDLNLQDEIFDLNMVEGNEIEYLLPYGDGEIVIKLTVDDYTFGISAYNNADFEEIMDTDGILEVEMIYFEPDERGSLRKKHSIVHKYNYLITGICLN